MSRTNLNEDAFGGPVAQLRPRSCDLSTANSQPGEDGSKPCSISQRAARRLRQRPPGGGSTSRSAPVAVDLRRRRRGAPRARASGSAKVEQGIAGAGVGPVDHAGDVVAGDEHVGELQVAVGEHRRPRPEGSVGDAAVACDLQSVGRTRFCDEPFALAVEVRSDARPGSSRAMAAAARRAASGRRRPPRPTPLSDAVDRSPRRPSAVPERAASASTGGFRHRTSGVGIGARAIASTSTSVRVVISVDLEKHVADAQVARSLCGDDDLQPRPGPRRPRPSLLSANNWAPSCDSPLAWPRRSRKLARGTSFERSLLVTSLNAEAWRVALDKNGLSNDSVLSALVGFMEQLGDESPDPEGNLVTELTTSASFLPSEDQAVPCRRERLPGSTGRSSAACHHNDGVGPRPRHLVGQSLRPLAAMSMPRSPWPRPRPG